MVQEKKNKKNPIFVRLTVFLCPYTNTSVNIHWVEVLPSLLFYVVGFPIRVNERCSIDLLTRRIEVELSTVSSSVLNFTCHPYQWVKVHPSYLLYSSFFYM